MLFTIFLPSIESTRERTRAKHVFTWRQTSEFQVSNFQVFPPNCEVLLLDTAQREDDSYQKERKKLWERCPTFNDLPNQVKELAQDHSFSEVGRRLGCNFKNRYAIHFTFGRGNFKVWHLKLRRLTSRENMFCTSAFTGGYNRRYGSWRNPLFSLLPKLAFSLTN